MQNAQILPATGVKSCGVWPGGTAHHYGSLAVMAQHRELTLGRLKELVAQHAPVLHMHPRDDFMPCSVEWFMDHSELWLLGDTEVRYCLMLNLPHFKE